MKAKQLDRLMGESGVGPALDEQAGGVLRPDTAPILATTTITVGTITLTVILGAAGGGEEEVK